MELKQTIYWHFEPALKIACISANPLFGVKKVQSGFTKDTHYKITVAMEKSGHGRKLETDNQMKDNVQKYLYAIKVRITEIMGHAIDTTWAVELNTQEHYVSF